MNLHGSRRKLRNGMFSSIAPQKANLDYCRFLESLDAPEIDYTEAITVFWAIEVVYQQSFAHCLEDDSSTPTELRETCERWGNKGFEQYCSSLERIPNRCLEKASFCARRKAEVTLINILEQEVAFWNMSSGGSQVA